MSRYRSVPVSTTPRPLPRVRGAPCRDGIRRAPGVQRDHDGVAIGVRIRPRRDDARGECPGQMPLPAPSSLPIAVVGRAQRRAHDDYLRHTFAAMQHRAQPTPPAPEGAKFSPTALRDSRARTLSLLDAYVDALGPALLVPYSEQLNPPLWEAGHVGWFQDYWIARNRQRALGIHCDPDHERPNGRLPQADALYDSSRVAHATRWQLPLPDLAATRAYLAEGLARDAGVARRHARDRRRPVFLPPRAVPRRHAHGGRDLHGAGAGHPSARRARSARRRQRARRTRSTSPRKPGRWATPAAASPSTTSCPPTASMSRPSRSMRAS